MAGLGQNEMEAQGRHAVAGPVERQVRRRFGAWTERNRLVVLRLAVDGKSLCNPCVFLAARGADRFAARWTSARADRAEMAEEICRPVDGGP